MLVFIWAADCTVDVPLCAPARQLAAWRALRSPCSVARYATSARALREAASASFFTSAVNSPSQWSVGSGARVQRTEVVIGLLRRSCCRWSGVAAPCACVSPLPAVDAWLLSLFVPVLARLSVLRRLPTPGQLRGVCVCMCMCTAQIHFDRRAEIASFMN